jgi:hypothetical protein
MFNTFESFVMQSRTTSLVPVFFQSIGMEIQRHRNVCCVLTEGQLLVSMNTAFVKTL